MVARTPPKRTRVAPLPLDPALLRETVKKVDRCMARLQELQYTVAGGNKVVAGVSLSPRSTRAYLKTSLRCKQESLRHSNGVQRLSPPGKFQGGLTGGEWKRMSLPAMLVGETVGEIIQASQFAREIVQAVASITQAVADDPKTPVTNQRKHRPEGLENSQLRIRRKREKNASHSFRSEPGSPKLQRARSRINFKVSPPRKNEAEIKRECERESSRHAANRVSPRHKPWAKKTVLFPNPLFTSASPTHQQPMRFCRTRSPVIARNKQTPHKFLIKSPASASSKFQLKVKKSPPKTISPTRTVAKKKSPLKPRSPIRSVALAKRSPKTSAASKMLRTSSPARLACCIKTVSPPSRGASVTIAKKSPKMSAASRLRRSLSPARLANRLMSISPMKSRKPAQTSGGGLMPGSKQRPTTPMRFLIRGS